MCLREREMTKLKILQILLASQTFSYGSERERESAYVRRKSACICERERKMAE